jgi:hypothetical protein
VRGGVGGGDGRRLVWARRAALDPLGAGRVPREARAEGAADLSFWGCVCLPGPARRRRRPRPRRRARVSPVRYSGQRSG